MKGWDSKRVIGMVLESYKEYLKRQNCYDMDFNPIWRAYYNGWLEGRGDMLNQMEEEKRKSRARGRENGR